MSTESLDTTTLHGILIDDIEKKMSKRTRDRNDYGNENSSHKIRKVSTNILNDECHSYLTKDDECSGKVIIKEDDNDNQSIYSAETVVSDEDDDSSDCILVAQNSNLKVEKSRNVNEHLDVNDTALMNGLFSQFSDEDDDSGHSTSFVSTQHAITQSSLPEISKVLEEKPSKVIKFDSGINSEDIHFEDGFDFSCEWDDDEKCILDLSKFTRCRVLEIVQQKQYTEITVEDEDSYNRAKVICSGNWRSMKISIGELIVVRAEKCYDDWTVSNAGGLIVTHPDELVAGTSVVSGIFCERKGVLLQKYSGINCLPNIPADDAVMTCGTIIHEMLQMALKKQIYKTEELWKLLDRILQYPHIVLILYASDLKIKDIKDMVDQYVVQIYNFLNRYIIGCRTDEVDNNFQGTIECIRDIEENVWLPSLGIKGKIDVTVEVNLNNKRKIMPLEIKTGRTLFSAEHKGQLYLYCMMLNNLGYEIDSGLLLYIKENRMKEIQSTRHEQRDLILLRNSLAYYIKQSPFAEEKLMKSGGENIKSWTLPELPEPINHVIACKRCPFSTICCTYAQEAGLTFPDNHNYNLVYESALKHLTNNHIDYVKSWICMLQVEDQHNRSTTSQRVIWSQKPIIRESRGTCLSYLKIIPPVVNDKDEYLHTFVRASINNPNIKFSVINFKDVFAEGEYLMINTCIRINIITGPVVSISKESVTISLAKDITRWKTEAFYHVDAVPSPSMPHKVLGTVATLLADNDIARRLRSIIIDKVPATFSTADPEGMKTEEGLEITQRLNMYQLDALKAAMQTQDFVMIKGMPGTGKTQTLVTLIELFSHLGYSVLIVAHTHVAVDNILLKLHYKNINFLRLGSRTRIHPCIQKYSDENFIRQCKTPEILEAKFNKMKIVGVTCLGANHSLLSRRVFDYCVVDECTQILQPVIIRPLFNADKYIIVGDPDQLSAVVRSTEARRSGMDQDIFSRLDSENNTRVLKQQYRMNKPIMDLANELTYKGELLMGNDKVAHATLQYTNTEIMDYCEEWVKKALSYELEHAVVMLNTQEVYNLGFKSKSMSSNEVFDCISYLEAAIILRLLNVLIEVGIKTEDIGIIAPYTAQVHLLKRLVTRSVEINTVDQYQGRDKSVILLSCTKNDLRDFNRQACKYEILEDHTRLNVALTRAKHKLIIIGNKLSLTKYTPFEKLFTIIRNEEIVLKRDCDGFSLDKLSQLINE